MSLHKIAWYLVLVGALNWGLSALGFNVVEMVFGSIPGLSKVVYLLVGAAAVYKLVGCKDCLGKKKR